MKTTIRRKKVGNHYQYYPDEILGSGRYGIVYKAQIIETKQKCAVKVMQKDKISKDSFFYKAIEQQVEIMKNMDSPFIIKLLSVQESRNSFYIFQQLAEGGTLGQRIKSADPIEEEQAVLYLAQIVQGFGELIKFGIIHRDLKPENILIHNKQIKITDFNLSKYSENISAMKTVVGTLTFMAPQILDEQVYSYKCDIWSFGVIAYILITKRIPWDIQANAPLKELLEEIKKTTEAGIKFPKDVQISEAYKDLVLGCLKYEEIQRYDWTKILHHPVFEKRIEFKRICGDEINMDEGFAMVMLRACFHNKNININELFEKYPQKISFEEFYNAILSVDKTIKQEEAIWIFKSITHHEKFVNKSHLLERFRKHGIKLKGLRLSHILKNWDAQCDPSIEQMKSKIMSGEINLREIMEEQADEAKSLNLEKFIQMISAISQKLDESITKKLFEIADAEKKGEVHLDQCYEILCKIMMIPANMSTPKK